MKQVKTLPGVVLISVCDEHFIGSYPGSKEKSPLCPAD